MTEGGEPEPRPAAGERFRWVRRPPRLVLEAGRVVVVLAVVAIVVKVGVDNAASLRHIHLHVRAGWLVASLASSLAGGLMMPMGWRRLIAAYGPAVGVRASLRVWWTAQITRYVPSGAAALASRVVLAAREGVPRVLAGASLPIEVAVVVGWGTVLTGAFLPDPILPISARLLVVAAGAGGLVALPGLLGLAGRYLPRMPIPLPSSALRIYESELFYAVNSLLRTAAFVFLAAALVSVHGNEVTLLAGALNAGAVAGLVSIAPGGLGVREGVLALVLRTRLGFGDAAAIAVALRASDLVVDLTWLAVARVAGRRKGRAEPRRSDVVEVAPGQ